jgi:hypothetical protein
MWVPSIDIDSLRDAPNNFLPRGSMIVVTNLQLTELLTFDLSQEFDLAPHSNVECRTEAITVLNGSMNVNRDYSMRSVQVVHG